MIPSQGQHLGACVAKLLNSIFKWLIQLKKIIIFLASALPDIKNQLVFIAF